MIKKFFIVLLLLLSPLASSTPQNELDEALHDAVLYEELDEIKKLLKEGANINSTDAFANTPLMIAARGKLVIVIYLIENGAFIDAINDAGETPLIRAAYTGKLGVVKYLVSKGADIHAKDNNGLDPLTAAQGMGKAKVVNYLKTLY